MRGYPPIAPSADLPFRLQENELILKEFHPQPRVILRIAIGGIIASLLLFFFLLLPFGFALASSAGTSPTALSAVVAVFLFIILIILAVSLGYGYLAYSKFHYWITNHRTVGRRGVVGYSVDSIPLENVADVIVNRSIWDRILGLSSVFIQPIGGLTIAMPSQPFMMGGLSGSNSFIGVNPQEAPEIQQLIFHLRDIRKRETGRIL